MINLLPLKLKQELSRERTKKIVIILGILILSGLICLVLILLSIKIYIQGQADYEKTLYELKQEQFKNSQTQEIQKEIIEHNENLLKISTFYQNQIDFTEIIEKITIMLPVGVYLDSISYQNEQISISGYAPDRDSLLEFKEKLDQDDYFEITVFPSSSWIKSIDIDFSLSFKLIQENEDK